MLKHRFAVGEKEKLAAVRHYDALASHYDEHVSAGVLALLRLREHRAMLEALKLDDPAVRTLVDVGCGGGYYAIQAKERGLRVAVVDASRPMVRRLEGRVDWADVGDIEWYRSPRRYDRVVCAGVLDFVVDPERAFGNLIDLMTERGCLVLLVPMRGLWSLAYRFEKSLSGMHVNLFSMEWFGEMARRHSLRLVLDRRPLPYNRVLRFERMADA